MQQHSATSEKEDKKMKLIKPIEKIVTKINMRKHTKRMCEYFGVDKRNSSGIYRIFDITDNKCETRYNEIESYKYKFIRCYMAWFNSGLCIIWDESLYDESGSANYITCISPDILHSNLTTQDSKCDLPPITHIVIAASIQFIPQKCFANFKTLKYIHFEENTQNKLTTIHRKAFIGCDKLVDIDIPYNVSHIASKAFAGCTNLKELSFDSPEDILMRADTLRIGVEAFARCTSLTDVNLPIRTGVLGPYAFAGCTQLKHCDITEFGPYPHKKDICICDNVFAGCAFDSMPGVFMHTSTLNYHAFSTNACKDVTYITLEGIKVMNSESIVIDVKDIDYPITIDLRDCGLEKICSNAITLTNYHDDSAAKHYWETSSCDKVKIIVNIDTFNGCDIESTPFDPHIPIIANVKSLAGYNRIIDIFDPCTYDVIWDCD